MARTARHKSTEAAYYHLTNRVAGSADWFPFENPEAGQKLLDMMLFYVNVYRCRLAAFQIMGNHFHFIVHFEKPRPLSREELEASARKLYGPKAEVTTADWTDAQWKAFNEVQSRRGQSLSFPFSSPFSVLNRCCHQRHEPTPLRTPLRVR